MEQSWAKEWGGQCLWSWELGFKQELRHSDFVPTRLGLRSILDCMRARRPYDHGKCKGEEWRTQSHDLYAPNKPSERKLFLEQLWHYKLGDENLMLAGDFNCLENLET